jgi:hypothetical protein
VSLCAPAIPCAAGLALQPNCTWVTLASSLVGNSSYPALRQALLEDWSLTNWVPEAGSTAYSHFFAVSAGAAARGQKQQ